MATEAAGEQHAGVDGISAGERFIPVRQSDLVDLLAEDGLLQPDDQEAFRALADLLDATVHFEFRTRLEALKDA